MKKKLLAIFLLAAMIATALCGCGGSKTNTTGSDDANTSKPDVQANAPKEIVVGIAQDLGNSLDPYQMTAAGTREILFNVYEGLYKPNAAGDLIPALAVSYTADESGLVYTFTLREGVAFHNGSLMTADDVVYSFETCAAATVDSSLVGALSNLESVKASEDGKTVTVTLKTPDSDILAYIASVYIVPKDYQDQTTNPVGTGPFRFVSRSVQQNVVLEKFGDYWGEKAKVDKVTCKIYEDANALMTSLNAGTIDLVAHLSSSQVEGLPEQYQVLEGTMNLVQALYLNNGVEPLDDVRVRQALSYAVDADALMQLTADGHGTRVGSSMYPAFAKYFDESLNNVYTHDTEKAKALLADAGYPDGFSLEITVPSNYTPHMDAAQVLVQQLAEVGVKAEIKEVEWDTWLKDVYSNRNFQSTVIGFDASNLTANAMLQRWTTDSKKNMINFSDSEYDALIAEANSTMDDAKRTELYRQAEKVLTEQAANVYIQDLADFVVLNKKLTGYNFYPLYVMDLSTIEFAD